MRYGHGEQPNLRQAREGCWCRHALALNSAAPLTYLTENKHGAPLAQTKREKTYSLLTPHTPRIDAYYTTTKNIKKDTVWAFIIV